MLRFKEYLTESRQEIQNQLVSAGKSSGLQSHTNPARIFNPKGMTNGDFVDLINTFLMLVRYPSEIDMDRRKRHAPHIRVLMSMIKNGIDTRESTYKCISNVHKYMLAQAEKMSDSGETLEDAMPELKDRARKMAEDRIHGAFPNPEDDDIDADLLEEMITNIAKDRLKDLIRILNE